MGDIEQRVAIKETKGRIVIEPLENIDFKLEDSVAGIPRQNVHDEISFDGPAGREAH